MPDAPKTLTLDADGLTDLQIIAQRQPGKGAALQRMIDRAHTTHTAIAEDIGRSRSAVSSWVAEARWPTDEDIRRTLVSLGIDRKQLLDTWGVLLATDVAPRDDLTLTARQIKAELDFEFDPLERTLIIFRGLRDEILIRQGFKAREDTRAAEFFFAKGERAEEEKRQRALGSSRQVTNVQAQAVDGDIYEAPSARRKPVAVTTIGSNEMPNNSAAGTSSE